MVLACSMCNDRGWFTSYTAFQSRAGSIYNSTEDMEVAGIGTVVLPVKRSPNRRGSNAHTHIVLKEVLHCPTAFCNILGFPQDFREVYNIKIQFGTGNEKTKGSIINMSGGEPVAYFDPKGPLFQLKLSGPPIGPVLAPTAFKPDGLYMISVRWSDEERSRWEAYKQIHDTENSKSQGVNDVVDIPTVEATAKSEKTKPTSQPGRGTAPYTAEEKAWLKKNYKDEYHFLLQHGLKIFKEEDREDGRAIVRAFMKEEEMEDDDEEEYDSEDDLEGHMADYHFDEKSLEWIEKHYGNSMNFMICHGLKFYNDEDCDEAKAIVRAWMEDSDAEESGELSKENPAT